MALSNIPEAWNRELDYNLDVNLNPELQAFLDDGLQSDEAQALTEVFHANVGEILNVSVDNLKLLREKIWTTHKTVWAITDDEKRVIANIANWVNIEPGVSVVENEQELSDFSAPLYSVWLDVSDAQDEYIESVRAHENEFDEYDADFEEMNDADFDAYMDQFWDTLQNFRLDSSKDLLPQIKSNKALTMQLQLHVWADPDGNLWPNTIALAQKFINENEWVDSMEDILTMNNFQNFEYDSELNGLDEFTEKYWFLSAQIENTFWLDNYTIASTAGQETSWGKTLTSPTNAKWLMWITSVIFEDMAMPWQTRKYLKLLQWDNWENKLKTLLDTIGPNGDKISEMLPDFITDLLISLWEAKSEAQAADIFMKINTIMKSSNTSMFLHPLNLIMGWLYKWFLINVRWKNKWKDVATLRYNWGSDPRYVQNVENRKQELLKDSRWSEIYKTNDSWSENLLTS